MGVTVSMDHGVATFPQDGDQADQLIRVADERLYQLKHANHSKASAGGSRTGLSPSPAAESSAPAPSERQSPLPKPIPFESKRPPEKSEPAVASATASEISS